MGVWAFSESLVLAQSAAVAQNHMLHLWNVVITRGRLGEAAASGHTACPLYSTWAWGLGCLSSGTIPPPRHQRVRPSHRLWALCKLSVTVLAAASTYRLCSPCPPPRWA